MSESPRATLKKVEVSAWHNITPQYPAAADDVLVLPETDARIDPRLVIHPGGTPQIVP
ncbi:MAG: hypothetical protein H0V18_15310 [Pyrinomonadaceae bacterium]|nr:hypothetical protein [Pyrinomonadaceae bacterium]